MRMSDSDLKANILDRKLQLTSLTKLDIKCIS
jgi:hypothetical protein